MSLAEHYGCYQTPRAAGYFAPDRDYRGVGSHQGYYRDVMRWIDNTMSRDCRYDKKSSDKRCEGCGK